MRALIHEYLNRRVSRRDFIARVAGAGFSVAAATSLFESLASLIDAEAEASAGGAPTMVEGSGADLLVAQLRAADVRFVFNCTSASTYPIFDALLDRPDVQVIQALQEGQMVAMAQGYALGSGRAAFTLNDSSGFPNTLTNMFNASRDGTPLLIGSQREAKRLQGGRQAYEEWDDFLGPAASFTRWRWSVESAERIPEITRRAFTIAYAPPTGPVALAFPEDVLATKGVRAAIVERERFVIAPKLAPSAGLVEEAARLLLEAKNPVLLVGSEVTTAGGVPAVTALAEALALPVVQAESLFADFPTDHPLFLGDVTVLESRPEPADLFVNVGARMPWDGGVPASARVVHVTTDAERVGRIVPTDVGIVADVKEAAVDLLAAVQSLATRERIAALAAPRLEATRAHTERLRAGQARAAQALWDASPLSWERVAGELERALAKDAIVVSEVTHKRWDAGWTWAADRASGLLEKSGITTPALGFAQNTGLSQLTFGPDAKMRIGKSTGGALGWGVGAAIGVKLAQPDRQVVALQGDGSFLFGQAEALWTMARYEVPVVVVVFNNRSYNSPRNQILIEGERQRQAGREMTCYLGDPDVDFAKIAAAFGIAGEVVTAADQVAPALQRALTHTRDGRPYLIDAVIARTGVAAESTWYPRYSVAAARTAKV